MWTSVGDFVTKIITYVYDQLSVCHFIVKKEEEIKREKKLNFNCISFIGIVVLL